MRSTDDQVDLVFKDPVENKKVLVQRIDFSGNDHMAPTARSSASCRSRKAGFAAVAVTNSGTFRRDQLDMDMTPRSPARCSWEEGYVDVQVDPPKVYLSPDKRYIFISYPRRGGASSTSYGNIDVHGRVRARGAGPDPRGGASRSRAAGPVIEDIQEDQWRQATGRPVKRLGIEATGPRLREGDVFKYTTLNGVMSAVADFYSDQGYAFTNVIPKTNPNPETRIVDVDLYIEKGEKVRLGKIDITGNNPTFDKVIRRQLLVEEGDVYRGSRIRASKQRLQRLGFFEEVNISNPRGDAEDVLDMNIQVTERPTGSFSLGLGFSNLENFVFQGSIQKDNFMGLGYSMAASVNVSAVRQAGNLTFFDPHFLDSKWTLNVRAYSNANQFITQLQQYTRGGTLGIGRYLDRRDDLRLSLDYIVEDRGLTTLDAYRKRMFGGELFRSGITSQVGLTFSVDKRNNRIQATKGWYASAMVMLAGGFRLDDDNVMSVLGGDFNLVEGRANFRLYQPIIPRTDQLVFRFNSTFGIVRSTDGRTVPFIHRFRPGGITSLRGYNWFSLGPRSGSPRTRTRPAPTTCS